MEGLIEDMVTREELLKIAKPILFNTEMVKAILEGRKTVTRRCVKYKYSNTEMKMRTDKYGTCLVEIQKDVEGETYGKNADGTTWHKLLPFIEKIPPFKKGDILYIRETWSEWTDGYVYRAWCSPFPQPGKASVMKWHPSLHMPKEAARIFLKVKDVRAERLNDMNLDDFLNEGIMVRPEAFNDPENAYWQAKDAFIFLWNSTINKSDIVLYGWDASPWVWVIEFERIEPDCEV